MSHIKGAEVVIQSKPEVPAQVSHFNSAFGQDQAFQKAQILELDARQINALAENAAGRNLLSTLHIEIPKLGIVD